MCIRDSAISEGLDPTAPSASRCDRGGNDGGLGDGRGTRCDGLGHDRGFGNGRADHPDSSDACWSEWHLQSPSVALVSSASIEAMMAWIGIRPLAIS